MGGECPARLLEEEVGGVSQKVRQHGHARTWGTVTDPLHDIKVDLRVASLAIKILGGRGNLEAGLFRDQNWRLSEGRPRAGSPRAYRGRSRDEGREDTKVRHSRTIVSFRRHLAPKELHIWALEPFFAEGWLARECARFLPVSHGFSDVTQGPGRSQAA